MNDVKKRMPYDEPQGYVEQLVEKSTVRALKGRSAARGSHMVIKVAAAAVVLIAAGVTAWHVMPSSRAVQPQSARSAYAPIDEFLEGISDEEASQINYYEIEEITEI